MMTTKLRLGRTIPGRVDCAKAGPSELPDCRKGLMAYGLKILNRKTPRAAEMVSLSRRLFRLRKVNDCVAMGASKIVRYLRLTCWSGMDKC